MRIKQYLKNSKEICNWSSLSTLMYFVKPKGLVVIDDFPWQWFMPLRGPGNDFPFLFCWETEMWWCAGLDYVDISSYFREVERDGRSPGSWYHNKTASAPITSLVLYWMMPLYNCTAYPGKKKFDSVIHAVQIILKFYGWSFS